MNIIPAIEIKDGRCVQLYQGDFARSTVYSQDPVDIACQWIQQGAQRLHVVDLNGARAGHPVNTDTVMAIVRSVSVPVQLGGGLRTESDVDAALGLGVAQVILGTVAVQTPDKIARLVARYSDAISVSVDARDGMVQTAGWTEHVPLRATDLADRMAQIGVRQIIYTDISRDGTLTEPNFVATAALVHPGGPAVVASGGICRIEHLRRLSELGITSVVIGKALYTGALKLGEATAALG